MLFGKKKCTVETEGTATKIYSKGQITYVEVIYCVNDEKYSIKETVKLKIVPIEIDGLAVGQRKKPIIENLHIDAKIPIMYNPHKPECAYIKNNIGFINC